MILFYTIFRLTIVMFFYLSAHPIPLPFLKVYPLTNSSPIPPTYHSQSALGYDVPKWGGKAYRAENSQRVDLPPFGGGAEGGGGACCVRKNKIYPSLRALWGIDTGIYRFKNTMHINDRAKKRAPNVKVPYQKCNTQSHHDC